MRNKRQNGFSVIEVILVIMIIAVAVPPILTMFGQNLTSSMEAEFYTKAVYYCEERLEQILADKRALSSGKGYDYILQVNRYPDDNPESVYTRTVTIDTVGHVYESIRYAEVMVSVSHPQIITVVLGSWVTDYE